ncbi:MAG: HD domain-containing protein [Dongiaceae bacterium]
MIKFNSTEGIDYVLWNLIGQPEFQRLRRIRQLGFADIVFPGATHSRFSHALGAMQMARSMLDVLRKNRAFKDSRWDPRLWEPATLCAALLHDVGHGPFSHVFEEVSEDLCSEAMSHEDWTLEFISNGGVADILKKHSSELLANTKSFFETEPGYNPYSAVVSSQLDADRLDFLFRDRHYTGVKFGGIDLSWILDSLQIQEVQLQQDVTEFCFVISEKGLSAVQEYIYLYMDMYNKVYFHKTARAAQTMMYLMLKEVLSNTSNLSSTIEDLPIIQFFEQTKKLKRKNRTKNLGQVSAAYRALYLRLDDTAVWALVNALSIDKKQPGHNLACRLLNRDLFKPLTLPKRPTESFSPQKKAQFEKQLNKKGIVSYRDTPPPKGFKKYEFTEEEPGKYLLNILVESEFDREPKPISSLVPALAELAERPPARLYFLTEADRSRARDLWKEIDRP